MYVVCMHALYVCMYVCVCICMYYGLVFFRLLKRMLKMQRCACKGSEGYLKLLISIKLLLLFLLCCACPISDAEIAEFKQRSEVNFHIKLLSCMTRDGTNFFPLLYKIHCAEIRQE